MREDNYYSGKTYIWTYDKGGNILTKSEYAYTAGTPGEPLNTVNYSYGNSDWKDLLTEYNGTAISYDLSGNPLNWRNASSLTWDGRRLAGMTLTDGTELAFEYNSAGIRIGKTVGTDKTVEYLLDGTKIIREIRKVNGTVTETLLYYYNTDGDVIGLNYNGTDYYYGRNMQGDILYIYNTSGEIVTTYAYDAWGSIVSQTGTLSSTVGEANPFRYRGYYLDSETGLYYLQSRYYDPTVGRFLNADDVNYLDVDRLALDNNLYAYCENDPVQCDDVSGHGKILAIGFQFAISVGKFTLGIEGLWSTKNRAFYLFAFVGGISKNYLGSIETAFKQDLAELRSYIPKISIKSTSLLRKCGISLSFVMVLGNKHAQFPKNYCGWFTSLSLSFRHITASGGYSKSGKVKIGSIGIGVTSSVLSANFSQTYYFQLTGAGAKANNVNALLSSINDYLARIKLLAFLF